MKNLLSDYVGKIDVMPIDPPYNTAIKHIEYKDDSYMGGYTRFIKERIELAYKLLSPTGVMFIHIDESEFCNLWMLFGEIFGANNLISMVWKKAHERFDKNRIEKPLESGVRRTHEFVIACFKDRANTQLNQIKQPVWNGAEYVQVDKPLETILDDLGTTASAKDELAEIFKKSEVFSTPKPVKLIKELIRSASNKESIVMDIFAGSGTAGHAVMELNKEDNGQRKFILITNSENNICQTITIPRIEKSIEKYNFDEEFNIIK